MKKVSKGKGSVKAKPVMTVGLDLGDRSSHYCVLQDGEVIEEGKVQNTEQSLRRHFGEEPVYRIALESGTHSPWVSRLLESFGHEVIVANSRKIAAITSSESKNDRNDAEWLARFGAADPKLLSPIHHRSVERQHDLNLLRSRDALVRARTMLVNVARGLVKSAGYRLPSCSPASFPRQAAASVPVELRVATTPLFKQVELLSEQIKEMDRKVEALREKYSEIDVLRTVPGVGPVVAAAYVLTLDSPHKASHRSAGAFLGLRPGQSQSGDSDPQRRISKTGNVYLRSLLVQSAQYILGHFGPDSAIKRWGLKLAAGGGKRARKRAIVAVARKLAVMLHSMWSSGKLFQPFPQPETAVKAA